MNKTREQQQEALISNVDLSINEVTAEKDMEVRKEKFEKFVRAFKDYLSTLTPKENLARKITQVDTPDQSDDSTEISTTILVADTKEESNFGKIKKYTRELLISVSLVRTEDDINNVTIGFEGGFMELTGSGGIDHMRANENDNEDCEETYPTVNFSIEEWKAKLTSLVQNFESKASFEEN